MNKFIRFTITQQQQMNIDYTKIILSLLVIVEDELSDVRVEREKFACFGIRISDFCFLELFDENEPSHVTEKIGFAKKIS